MSFLFYAGLVHSISRANWQKGANGYWSDNVRSSPLLEVGKGGGGRGGRGGEGWQQRKRESEGLIMQTKTFGIRVGEERRAGVRHTRI